MKPKGKNMLRLLPIIACMAVLPLLQNCGPDKECEEYESKHTQYTISNDDKSKIPFTGTDTLIYISNTGDTAVLYGQGKKAFTEKVAERRSYNPACPTFDYNYFENIEYFYVGTHSFKELFFSAYVNQLKDEMAHISINKTYRNNGYGLLFISNEIRYKDSTEINGKYYVGFNIVNNDGSEFLYNWKYGFLKLHFNNLTWKLAK